MRPPRRPLEEVRLVQIPLFPELCRPELSAGAKRLLGIIHSLHSIRGEAFPFQRTLARRLGVCVRTIKRWLRNLIDAGLVIVQRRGPTSALYLPQDVPSNVPSFESASFKSYKEPENNTPRASYAAWKGTATVKADGAFDAYMDVFKAAGKPLNSEDYARAWREWERMPFEERLAAGRDVVTMCVQTQTQFIPHPANHLRNKPWTRVAVERSLPYRPPLERAGKIGQAISNAWKRLTANGEDW